MRAKYISNDNHLWPSISIQATAEDKIFLIYLDELYRQFEAILHESTAKKMRRHETTEFVRSSSEKLARKIAKLMSHFEQAQLKFREANEPKRRAVQSLMIEMTQMKSDFDDKIEDIM